MLQSALIWPGVWCSALAAGAGWAAIACALHIRRVIAPHDAFAQAFGPD